MIEIYLLEQLIAFYDCGTLSLASEKLHISQPALSRSMQKLEDLLGVTLFERQKNKITLNKSGLLVVKHAKKILEQERKMIEDVHEFDRRNKSISLGSCAPAPITAIMPILSKLYLEMNISTKLADEQSLLKGLNNDTYNIIILNHMLNKDSLYVKPWLDEHLYITLPLNHPLSNRKSLYLKDLNGETMLLYSQVGFWHNLCIREMPDTNFIMQNEYDALNELVKASQLPAFATDLTMNTNDRLKNRVIIPIMDAEANVTFYCICKKKNQTFLSDFFNEL